QEGIPIPGVSVRVKGSSQGTSTGADGNYQLRLKSETDVLVFSMMGYQTAEVTSGKGTVLNVVLKETVSDLDEVVVIGYGEVKRADLTGSVGQVKMNDL